MPAQYIMVKLKKSKFYISVFILAHCLAGCNPTIKLGKQPQAVAPYVKLKDGKIIHAKEVGELEDFGGNRIVADDETYARTKVAEYSNGEQLFVNLRKGAFGPKIAEGKINVYSASNSAKYGYPMPDLAHLYIQKSGSSRLYYLSYHALKPMISDDFSAAGRELKAFRSTRLVCRLVLWGGFACFIAGAIKIGNSVESNGSDASTNQGLSTMVVGMGCMAVAPFPLYLNKFRLRRAIAKQNGVYASRDEE